MSIFVRKIQCLEDTDEFGSDGIYLVVFRGKTKPPFLSALGVHGPGVDWDDFSPGTVWDPVVKKKIFKTTSPDQVYAVVMVERDFGTDVSGEVLDHWQDVTATAWSSIMETLDAGGTTSASVVKDAGYALIKETLEDLAGDLDNDTKIAVRRIKLNESGVKTVTFQSAPNTDHASYKVTFRHT